MSIEGIIVEKNKSERRVLLLEAILKTIEESVKEISKLTEGKVALEDAETRRIELYANSIRKFIEKSFEK